MSDRSVEVCSNVGITNTTTGSAVPCPLRQDKKISLTYEFDTNISTKDGVRIPYAVIVNGKVQSAFVQKPRQLMLRKEGAGKDRRTHGYLTTKVPPRSKVALYLNSDAHPAHRTAPVFEVQVGDNDALVQVREIAGHRQDADDVRRSWTSIQEDGAKLDRFEAVLTGKTWMKISHRFTPAEVRPLLPDNLEPSLRDAVLAVYDGGHTESRKIRFHSPATGQAFLVELHPGYENNAKTNIAGFDNRRDGLPRVHPHAFLALVKSAIACKLQHILLTSGWRPMMGSIAHRAGLGLDIGVVKSGDAVLRINRKALKMGDSGGVNVSERERTAFNEREARQKALNAAQEEMKKSPISDTERVRIAERDAQVADANWKDILRREQPKLASSLRDVLGNDSAVSAVLDPWYMDVNTRDTLKPIPNDQSGGNEKNHNDHLHITIHEPKLL